jgi:hypothetical protein
MRSIRGTLESEASVRRSRRTYSKAEHEINVFQGSRVVDVDATEATEKPEHHQNNQDQAKNAAEAGPTVAIVAIVAAATAQENNQQDDDKDRAHHSTFLAKFNLPYADVFVTSAVVLSLYCVSERVFDTADGILHLALRLVGLSFGL